MAFWKSTIAFISGSYLLAGIFGCGNGSMDHSNTYAAGTQATGSGGATLGSGSIALVGTGGIGGAIGASAGGSAAITGVGSAGKVVSGGGKGGTKATGGKGGTVTAAGSGGSAGTTTTATTTEKFSFFVTSQKGLFKLAKALSGGDNGFGGDLRYGETGNGAGLRGADKICATMAENSMEGAGSKVWRAFLSAKNYDRDGKAGQVNAIDRIGNGPWYDRVGRVFSMTKADLLNDRPASAHSLIKNDFPNEDGVNNKTPDPSLGSVDNHDMLTGTNASGQLYSATGNCDDWTNGTGSGGKPRVGHSWPRDNGGSFGGGGPGGGDGGMNNWMSALDESGCAPGYFTPVPGSRQDSAPNPNDDFVGSGGGYGGFYCFALTP
jgi:hypothetical protein